ncbi:MAG: hypothetical protein EOP00_34230, partial [Pedobacter sp.]
KNSEEIDLAVNEVNSIENHKEFVNFLCDLLEYDWHFDHEDVVQILQKIGDAQAINILHKTALRKFEYLEYDDSKTLARKCTWALADIGTKEAKAALIELTSNSNKEIAGFAQKRIDNWEKASPRKKHSSL